MEKFRVRSRWVKMLSRCEDEDNPDYHNYGGRGIYVCEEWHYFSTFYSWCIDNGIKNNLQIDRVDNNGPYRPSNCRFVTRSGNARNKRSNRMLTAFGETKSMVEWSEDDRCTVNYQALLNRIFRKWPDEKAISTPPNGSRKNKTTHNTGIYTAFGQSKTLSEWIVLYPIERQTFHYRIKHGWTVEQALTGSKK